MIQVRPLNENLQIVVSEHSTPLSPEREAEVEALWEEERVWRGPGLFNGQIFSLDKKDGAGPLVGRFLDYRLLIAQRRRPNLYHDLLVVPLAVSGLLCCQDGLVFGRRHHASSQDAGLWELAPSGSVDPHAIDVDGQVDVRRQVLKELEEEIAIGAEQVTSIELICSVEDDATHIFDLVFAVRTRLAGSEVRARHGTHGTDEYAELEIVQLDKVEAFAAHLGDELAEVSRAILHFMRLAV